MVIRRYQGSGRKQESGYLATHKQDFMAHVTGGDWRHVANHIDMSPLLTRFPGSNVQLVLEEIETAYVNHVTGVADRHTARHIDMDPPLTLFPAPNVQETLELMEWGLGQGFVTIGDGYRAEDHVPQRDLYDAFQWAFTHPRLQGRGGIIVVKSGEYILNRTVTVPHGFTIWGEPAGARISTTYAPAFRYEMSSDRQSIGDGNTITDVSTKMSRMWNLSLFDNLYGTSPSIGILPAPPLIYVECGCNLLLENVTLIGKYTGANVTRYGVSVAGPTGATPSNANTLLHVKNCFIDAVGTGITFASPSNPSLGELKVENTRVRTFSLQADQAFVRAELGKVALINNYHIGQANSSSYPPAFLCLLNTNVETEDITVTLIGNKGGPMVLDSTTNTKNAARQRWIYDARVNTSKWDYQCTDIGNAWGATHSNNWYFTVGDGVHSAGDFIGVNVLDTVNALIDTIGDYSNSRTEQVVIVNPGSYTCSTSLNIPKLLGNVTATETTGSIRSVTINLNSNSQIGLGTAYENFIGLAKNINFVGNTHLQRIVSKINNTQDYITFENCSFTDCVVYIEHDNKVAVEKCFFHQTGTFENEVSLVVQNDETSIINQCEFTGYGYALMQSSFEGEAILSNCLFDPYKNTVGTGNRILTGSVLYNNSFKYIFVGELTSKVLIDNINVKCGIDGYTILSELSKSRMLVFAEFISDDALILQNSSISGPNQLFTLTYPIIGTYVSAEGSLVVRNNSFVGAMPLHISEFTANSNNSFGTMFQIIGNDIHHYINSPIPSATAMMIDLKPAGGIRNNLNIENYEDDDGYEGYMPFSTINISDNRFIGYYTKVAVKPMITWNYPLTKLGLCQILAPGWSVKFTNNDVIYICDNTKLPSGIDILAAVQIDNSSEDFVYATCHISGNNISHSDEGYITDFELENLAVFAIQTATFNMSDNTVLVNWKGSIQKRSYVDIISFKNGSLIKGNSFNATYPNNVTTPIQINTAGLGVLTCNWFDVDNPGVIMFGETDAWVLSTETFGPFSF